MITDGKSLLPYSNTTKTWYVLLGLHTTRKLLDVKTTASMKTLAIASNTLDRLGHDIKRD